MRAEQERCRLCGGDACEEGCGRCEWAYSGPDSHKVCRRCGGRGVEPDVYERSLR